MKNALTHLLGHDSIWRPWQFDRVTVCTATGPVFSIVGTCASPYPSGPSLIELADVAGELIGPGGYTLQSCRSLGFRGESAASCPVCSKGLGQPLPNSTGRRCGSCGWLF